MTSMMFKRSAERDLDTLLHNIHMYALKKELGIQIHPYFWSSRRKEENSLIQMYWVIATYQLFLP